MTYGVAWQDPKDTKNQIHNSGSSLCWDAQSTVKVMGTVTVLITILPLSSPTHLHRSASSAYSYHCSHIMALALLPFASLSSILWLLHKTEGRSAYHNIPFPCTYSLWWTKILHAISESPKSLFLSLLFLLTILLSPVEAIVEFSLTLARTVSPDIRTCFKWVFV